LLIRSGTQINYCAILSKIHSYRLLFFGDFAHWVEVIFMYTRTLLAHVLYAI